jgi:hypothetical protein
MFVPFMERECSLPFSQKFADRPYPEAFEYTLHFTYYFSNIHFNVTLPPMTKYEVVSKSFRTESITK